jgi:hypothetical protein
MLSVSVKPQLAVGTYSVIVQGKAVINGKPVVRYASVRFPASQNLAGLAYPPRSIDAQVGFAVTEKAPFTLAAKFDAIEYLRGGPANVTITATRDPGFAEEIALTATGLPPNVTAALKPIPKGQNELKVQLNAAANAPLGQFAITFNGATKHQGKDFSASAPPATLVLAPPFTLAATPAPLKLAPGDKAPLKVTASRRAGYQGPITVELRNLPANVTATKATIAMDQNAVDVEISAAANAAAGDKPDVEIVGVATAAGNQQAVSPKFTVSIQKK